MELTLFICSLIISAVGLLYACRTVYACVGFFTTKKFAAAQRQHKYAVVIAARNEGAVIGKLIDSIKKQDYPAHLITTFVVADNCSDSTAETARKHGAICYERFDTENATKGFALQYLFKQIERDYGIGAFEGYFVFDADNLLKSDFVRKMNDAFDSGERIITSYRNTKNFGDGWLAAGYGLHWLRTSRFDSRGRSALGLSTWLQGCGFLISSELLKDGWSYTTLTEDRSLSSDLIAKGVAISYQHEAQFYDEQPTSGIIAWRQRIRWAKGHLQALGESGKPLIKGIFCGGTLRERFMCYDMMTINLPSSVVIVAAKLVSATALTLLFAAAEKYSLTAWIIFLLELAEILIFEHLSAIPMAIAIFITERKRITHIKWYKKLWYSLMFPFFSMVGDVATCIALFKKVTWKPIPHNAALSIEELELNDTQQG